MKPHWLQSQTRYLAQVVDFIDNLDERKSGDGRLSVLTQFEKTIKFNGISGNYGLLDLRYEGGIWGEASGIVHVALLKQKIKSIE